MNCCPLILSMICSIVLNLYHHLCTELKLQLEAFFSCVILRPAQSRYGGSFQQQEVAMEAMVDFCWQKNFMMEMYANLDCDITCSNVFEELANLLVNSAFPVNCPLSAMHILALDGLIAVIQGMAEYTPFWLVKCDNYNDPSHWVPFVRRRKYIERRLMIGADHFNCDPKEGLEFLQGTHLLPDKLDPQSVACFFRFTAGLDKNLVGDFLGNRDEFCVQVLHEFAGTFDFQDMNSDTALQLLLETFRLPGESQKIQRVLEAFSERYYEQSPQILANKDAALLLAYSLIMLQNLSQVATFCKLWLGVLTRMEKYMEVKVRGKKNEKLQEVAPELLKNILVVMKTKGVLVRRGALVGDSLWELTWLHVNNIAPSLQSEVFPDQN